MTNPNNAIGTNAGFGGRTSPNALNDNLAAWTRGVISGWACSPKSGMIIQIGGSGSDRDVAVAEDNAGNKTTINNRNGSPVDITLSGASSTGNRIDSIVAYVDNPAQGTSSDVDYAPACGIIAVKGTVSSNPSAPTNARIRTAITADGANGTAAYYVVLANVTVGQGVTAIGSGAIAQGTKATLQQFMDSIATDSRLDIGKWHFYLTGFSNSAAGWQNHTLSIPSDFGGNIKDIHLSAAYGNSGENYGCTWFDQSINSVKVRFYQATAGSNGWFATIIAIF